MERIEFRVREITRYIVTSFESDHAPEPGVGIQGVSRQHGEFDNGETAYAVAYALCKQEHERRGYPVGDERVRYPAPVVGGRYCSPDGSLATELSVPTALKSMV